MEFTKQKRNSDDIFTAVNNKLNEIYSAAEYNKYFCNVNKNGVFFKLFCFSDTDCVFGIEYASNAKEAELGQFEDGDLFYLEDYSTIDEMIRDMCREINES